MRASLLVVFCACQPTTETLTPVTQGPAELGLTIIDAPDFMIQGATVNIRVAIKRVHTSAEAHLALLAAPAGFVVTGTVAANQSEGLAQLSCPDNTALGTYTLLLQADSDGLTAQAPKSIVVASKDPISAASYAPVTALTGFAMEPAPPQLTGGRPPLAFSIVPALPDGLSLAEATGVISGTPSSVAASAIYQVTVGDATGASVIAMLTLSVAEGCAQTCAPPTPAGWLGPVTLKGAGGCTGSYDSKVDDLFSGVTSSPNTCGCYPGYVVCATSISYGFGACSIGPIDALGLNACQHWPLSTIDHFQLHTERSICVSNPQLLSTGASSSTQNDLCASSLTPPGACPGGNGCVTQAAEVCVYQTGNASAQCPAGFPTRAAFDTTMTDGRQCPACVCDVLTPCAVTSVTFYQTWTSGTPTDTCGGGSTVIPENSACLNMATYNGWIRAGTEGVGSNPSGTTSSTGAVTTSGPVVVCCGAF